MKSKFLMILEYHVREYLHYFSVGKDFLNSTLGQKFPSKRHHEDKEKTSYSLFSPHIQTTKEQHSEYTKGTQANQ